MTHCERKEQNGAHSPGLGMAAGGLSATGRSNTRDMTDTGEGPGGIEAGSSQC